MVDEMREMVDEMRERWWLKMIIISFFSFLFKPDMREVMATGNTPL